MWRGQILCSADRMGSDTHSHATTSALADLPTFTPTAGFHTGLDLLAAAASSSSGDRPMARPTSGELGLTKPGPFNPAASLAPKVAKKILGPGLRRDVRGHYGHLPRASYGSTGSPTGDLNLTVDGEVCCHGCSPVHSVPPEGI